MPSACWRKVSLFAYSSVSRPTNPPLSSNAFTAYRKWYKKVKFSQTRYRLIPVYRQSVRKWLFKSFPITFRQACGHLRSQRTSLSFDRYPVILLCDRGTLLWITCQRLLSRWPRWDSNPRPKWSQVQRLTAKPPAPALKVIYILAIIITQLTQLVPSTSLQNRVPRAHSSFGNKSFNVACPHCDCFYVP